MTRTQTARLIGNVVVATLVLGIGVLLVTLWRSSEQKLPPLSKVRAWVENRHWEEAGRVIDQYLSSGDRRPALLFLAGRVRAATGRYDEALQLLEQIPEQAPDYLESVFRRGQILKVVGRRRKAESLFKQVIRLGEERNTPTALEYRRAAIYELVSMYSLERRAREAIPLIWGVYPEHTEPWRLLIALARLQGEPIYIEHALKDLLVAVQADAQDGISRRALAWYYLKGGNLDEAVRWAEEAAKLLPEDLDTIAVLFEAYVARQQFSIVEQWIRSHGLPKEAPVEFWKTIAQAYEGLGQLDLAERFYRRALRLAPNDHRIHFSLGGLLIRLKHEEEGKKHLARFRELKKHYDAIQLFISELGGDERAAEWTVPSPEKCVELATHCAGLGRTREAIGWAEMALAQNPAYSPAAEFLETIRRSGS